MVNDSFEQFIEEATGEDHLRVQDELGDGFVRLRAAEAQRRQAQQDIRTFEDIVIEMLRNARDAHATLIFVATWKDAHKRYLTILDNGDGIPDYLHKTVFEPFVTSKLDSFNHDRWGVHGRGMALYSIAQNATEAYIIESHPGEGSVFHVEASLDAPGEKKDQSTYPTLLETEAGTHQLRGPHNIIRTVLEFALDQSNTIAVYLGSPTEIAATLLSFSERLSSLSDQIFATNNHQNFLQRLSRTDDASDFTQTCIDLGLPLSDRTARRIIADDIKPLKPHITYLDQSCKQTSSSTQASNNNTNNVSIQSQKKRHFSFDKQDLAYLEKEIQKVYAPFADSYYLDSSVKPTISLRSGNILISIPLLDNEK